MKWFPMETAPRDGSPVVLLLRSRQDAVCGRYGETNKETADGPEFGWFELDWSDSIYEVYAGGDEKDKERDSRFAGWVPIPEVEA